MNRFGYEVATGKGDAVTLFLKFYLTGFPLPLSQSLPTNCLSRAAKIAAFNNGQIKQKHGAAIFRSSPLTMNQLFY